MDDINVILAEFPGLGRVRLCECNSVHLSIGPVTVNLAPQAFVQAATMIRDAVDELTKIAASRQPGTNILECKDPDLNHLVH